jgi:predicted transcriptional regulator
MNIVSASENLGNVLHFFEQGLHRVAVKDDSGRIIGVLTQGRVVRELLKHYPYTKKIADLKFKTDKVVTIPKNMRAIDGFLLMHAENVSSIGIIDGHRVVGNLSASDLKVRVFHLFLFFFSFFADRPVYQLLASEELSKLLLLVGDFINEIRSRAGKRPDFLIACDPNSDFKASLEDMMNNHVHRMFLLDNEEKPLGILSLTDVIREMAQAAAK